MEYKKQASFISPNTNFIGFSNPKIAKPIKHAPNTGRIKYNAWASVPLGTTEIIAAIKQRCPNPKTKNPRLVNNLRFSLQTYFKSKRISPLSPKTRPTMIIQPGK